MYTDEKEVTAQTVIIATGAVAKRLPFKGSDEVRACSYPGVCLRSALLRLRGCE